MRGARMTELGRLVRLVDRASATMLHVELDRITPMAVPLMVIVGREALPPGAEADEALLTQAEALAAEAMAPWLAAVNLPERTANGRIIARSTAVTRMCRSNWSKGFGHEISVSRSALTLLAAVGATIGGTAMRSGRSGLSKSARA